MDLPQLFIPDPLLDLVFERTVDLSPAVIWAAWTEPEYLMKWFTPSPWRTVGCEIDLRPGGIFKTVMKGPDGPESENIGSYIEVVPNERLVFTTALLPGFRPSVNPFMTGIITFQPIGKGTRYKALVRHPTEDGRKQHEEMHFHAGWGIACDQMVAYMKTV